MSSRKQTATMMEQHDATKAQREKQHKNQLIGKMEGASIREARFRRNNFAGEVNSLGRSRSNNMSHCCHRNNCHYHRKEGKLCLHRDGGRGDDQCGLPMMM